MKYTAVAPSNIAFIKYWGKKNEELRLPTHTNISMNLSNLLTTTTVEFDGKYKKDEVTIDGQSDGKDAHKVSRHLDRIRKLAGFSLNAKVVTNNNFPSGTGLSSSASGFAALTVAAAKAAGLSMSEKELSILARIGSGSACRSIPDGFVEWKEGTDSDSSYAQSLFPPDHWDIADVVAVASREKKEVPTTEGHKLAQSSPFYATRLSHMDEKIRLCRKLIKENDFASFGDLIEKEALEMHAVMITSNPSLIYWLPATVTIMKEVQGWRRRNAVEAYFTINTGQDVHVICRKRDAKKVEENLRSIPAVTRTIVNAPSIGARLHDSHLF